MIIKASHKNSAFLRQFALWRVACVSLSIIALTSFQAGYTLAAWTATTTIDGNSVTAGVWSSEPEGPEIGDLALFAVYGAANNSDTNNDTITGTNVTITGGMIGAPRGLLIGGGNTIYGMRTGNDVNTGSNTTVEAGGIVANDDVTLGGGNILTGRTHGDRIITGNNTAATGHVVARDSFLMGGGNTAVDVDADSTILGNNSHITGTLTLPIGESPIIGGGSSVATLVQAVPQAPDTFVNLVMPAANVFTASDDEDDDVGVDDNSPLVLLPGIYGELASSNNVSITLSSGTYVFEQIVLGGGVDITMDVSEGPIKIFVVGNVLTGNNTVMTVVGGDASDIYLESAGKVTLGGGNVWHGTIYSTKSTEPNQQGITTGSNTSVSGGLYSNQRILLGGGNTITLVGPYFATYTAPEENNDIVLNEIYPRPAGGAAPSDREWIELYNNSGSTIDILGWKVSEMSGSNEVLYTVVASGAAAGEMQPYAGASTEIVAGGMVVLEFNTLSGKLNDGGDTVRVYDNAGALRDTHKYPSTAVGKSHVRIPDGIGIWVDPEPTPGEVNRVSRADLEASGLTPEQIEEIVALLASRGEWLLGEGPGEILVVPTVEEPLLEETTEPQMNAEEGEGGDSDIAGKKEDDESIVDDAVDAADGGGGGGGPEMGSENETLPTEGDETVPNEVVENDDVSTDETLSGETEVEPEAQVEDPEEVIADDVVIEGEEEEDVDDAPVTKEEDAPTEDSNSVAAEVTE